jgi:glycerol-3-phosphate acyltransferase PlsX
MKAGKVILALDGMGGDHAPDVVVNGADLARERYPDTSYLLFGDPGAAEAAGRQAQGARAGRRDRARHPTP